MPNPPAHPRIALPPALAARVDALRAAATTGRPSRQAVVEAALAAGLEALEGGQAAPGGADGAEGAGRATGAPSGRVGSPTWKLPPNDPRWALDGAGKPCARESHIVAVEHKGRRVEVAVAAGDTVAVVRQALAAAWRARGGAVG